MPITVECQRLSVSRHTLAGFAFEEAALPGTFELPDYISTERGDRWIWRGDAFYVDFVGPSIAGHQRVRFSEKVPSGFGPLDY